MNHDATAGQRLAPEQTALVVVDMQAKLFPVIHARERVLRNNLLLLRLARVLALPVILTTQYQKGLGPTLPEILEAASGSEPLDKVSFGCFGSDAFRARVRELGRRQLLLAGIESHICVAQTALGALEQGYAVHVASDAVGSRSDANHHVGLARMEGAGALLSSAEMALYELLGRSDSAAFKELLPHLK